MTPVLHKLSCTTIKGPDTSGHTGSLMSLGGRAKPIVLLPHTRLGTVHPVYTSSDRVVGTGPHQDPRSPTPIVRKRIPCLLKSFLFLYSYCSLQPPTGQDMRKGREKGWRLSEWVRRRVCQEGTGEEVVRHTYERGGWSDDGRRRERLGRRQDGPVGSLREPLEMTRLLFP